MDTMTTADNPSREQVLYRAAVDVWNKAEARIGVDGWIVPNDAFEALHSAIKGIERRISDGVADDTAAVPVATRIARLEAAVADLQARVDRMTGDGK